MKLYKIKDFVKTAENFYFAVVKAGMEEDRVLCYLRYVYEEGRLKKIETQRANQILQQNYPEYLYNSSLMDTEVHGIMVNKIVEHRQPCEQLQRLLQQPAVDKVIADLKALCKILLDKGVDITQMGVTGSILVGAQNKFSDIDLVFYEQEKFNQARRLVRELIRENKLERLRAKDWQESYRRRGCELSYEEYHWHEERKDNKVIINNRKVDITLTELSKDEKNRQFLKHGKKVITVKITDDSESFNTPIKFLIEHEDIRAIICFTATYSGQAQVGEWVEVSGVLEIANDGYQQIVVGSSREAKGEYIRVVHGNH